MLVSGGNMYIQLFFKVIIKWPYSRLKYLAVFFKAGEKHFSQDKNIFPFL